jgi:hypothetical protein
VEIKRNECILNAYVSSQSRQELRTKNNPEGLSPIRIGKLRIRARLLN